MRLITRREYVQQTTFAAATLYGCPLKLADDFQQMFASREQNDAPFDSAVIRKLASGIRGRVITTHAPDYEAARLISNRAFDQRPAVLVRCAVESDVARVLDFAQTLNLPLAIHGGGHSRAGFGVCDGGVVIDFSGMRRIDVDAGKRVARAQAGALVRDLRKAE